MYFRHAGPGVNQQIIHSGSSMPNIQDLALIGPSYIMGTKIGGVSKEVQGCSRLHVFHANQCMFLDIISDIGLNYIL